MTDEETAKAKAEEISRAELAHEKRLIANGLLPHGLDVRKMTKRGKQDVRDGIDALLRLYK